MSRMPDRRGRRPRRQFDEEFTAQAVRLVLHDGKSVGAVAHDLDLTESALRHWAERTRADQTRGRSGLTTVGRDALAQLRKENRELRTALYSSITRSSSGVRTLPSAASS